VSEICVILRVVNVRLCTNKQTNKRTHARARTHTHTHRHTQCMDGCKLFGLLTNFTTVLLSAQIYPQHNRTCHRHLITLHKATHPHVTRRHVCNNVLSRCKMTNKCVKELVDFINVFQTLPRHFSASGCRNMSG
jgi:hypothetical protein